jgi:putative methyltransferase (TIGR04325 family)
MKSFSLWIKNNRFTKLFFKTPWIGMYPTFEEARAAIPDEARTGYNQQETFEVFRQYPIDRVRPADYAIMLHLRNLLKPGDRVVDLGGSIGMMCYTTQKYFPLPEGVEWIVCDVPKMTEAGALVAEREGAASKPLRFVHSLADAGRANVFFSSGALQFIQEPLPALLQSLPELPSAVLINRIPAWNYQAFSTIHDIGFCLAPYSIFNEDAFVESMQRIGYILADRWSCPESTFSVRFRPRVRMNAYAGFYFRRMETQNG